LVKIVLIEACKVVLTDPFHVPQVSRGGIVKEFLVEQDQGHLKKSLLSMLKVVENVNLAIVIVEKGVKKELQE